MEISYKHIFIQGNEKCRLHNFAHFVSAWMCNYIHQTQFSSFECSWYPVAIANGTVKLQPRMFYESLPTSVHVSEYVWWSSSVLGKSLT